MRAAVGHHRKRASEARVRPPSFPTDFVMISDSLRIAGAQMAVEAQYRYIVTFNTRDFAGVEQFGIQTLTLGEFLALLQEDA